MPLSTGGRRDDPGICVVGCGAVTPLGHDAPMTAASVRANLSRFRESRVVDKVGQPVKVSLVEVYDDSVRGVDRLRSLAVPAALEAVSVLDKAGIAPDVLSDAAICLGTALPRPGVHRLAGPQLLAGLASELSIHRPQKQHGIPAGHASSLIAFEMAHRLIGGGTEEFVLVGGVDSYYDPDTLEWLDEGKRLHSEANKDGFLPGEGAGFCLLTSFESAGRYGLTPLAAVLAPCTTQEPHPFVSDGVCLGEGLTNALHFTLDGALVGGNRADWTLCDMNGESFRGTEWLYAYLRTSRQHADPLEIWHPADCYGDLGAASGAVLATLAIAAWQRHYARGERALVWASSDDTQRAAMVLAAA